jgi:mRNA-degrading endonuclease RelE of RelBE toxin-antitoxin system
MPRRFASLSTSIALLERGQHPDRTARRGTANLHVGDWRIWFTFDDEQRIIIVVRVPPCGCGYRD